MLLEILRTAVSTLLAGGLIILTARTLGCAFLFPRDVRRMHEGIDALQASLERKQALIENLKSQNQINELVIETLTTIASNAEADRDLANYLSRDEVCQ